nr:GNAT family N-acetyltransferase [Pseudomonas sp. URMO17WK12:I2]
MVEYTEVFLELSWRWLNIPLIKEMTMTPDFSRAQQADFFSRIGPSHGNYVFGIAQNKKNIGACGVKNISGGSGELWLYIGEKEYWGLGLGRVIITKLEEIARLAGLSRLYLKVSSKNESAINLYLRAGYLIKSEACAGLINMEKML